MRWLWLVALAGCSSLFGFEDAVVGDATDLPRVQFASASTLTDEESGTVEIPLQLSAPASTDVVVSFSVVGGAATLAADYAVATTGSTVTFPAGETTGKLSIEIVADGLEEPDENIELVLSLAEGAVLGDIVTHQITIASNILPRVQLANATSMTEEGSPSSIALMLDAPAQGSCSVTLVLAGTATSADYQLDNNHVVTFADGETSALVPVSEIADALDEDDETIDITLASPTGKLLIGALGAGTHTIKDDDPTPSVTFQAATSTSSEAGPTQTISVSLSAVSGRTVTVPYVRGVDSADNTEAVVNGTSLTFLPGETNKTITIALTDDTLDEDDETVIVQLGSPTNAVLGGLPTHTVSLLDNDAAPKVSWVSISKNVTEGNVAVDLVLQLDTPSGRTITVPIDVGGTAGSNDFTLGTTVPVTFAPGITMVNVVVDVTEDSVNEPNETVRLTISTPTNAVLTGASTAVVTILDDD